MKNYRITVNGTAYDVTVEEGDAQAGAPVLTAPVQMASAPVKPAAPKAAPAAPAGTQGSVKIEAPMPGKILGVKVSAGQAVKKGQVMVVLEAMKMENEIIAPQDGTVVSVNVETGHTVEAGNILATLN